VTLWDDRADRAAELSAGAVVEVVDGYVRERQGSLELHVGDRGAVEELDEEDVTFDPETEPIDGLELDTYADIGGVVRSAEETRTFDRDDGSEGQVRNVRIQDDTGDIRVALWGPKADMDVHPGDEVFVADAEIQDGWQDDLEASAGWQSSVIVLEDGASAPSGDTTTENSGATGLDAFADGDSDADTDDADAAADADSSTASEDAGAVEMTEFTGTVVQTGDPVILDDGTETVSVQTGANVQLGEEVTVRGHRDGDTLDADELF
jgi:replication factor A1